jgi:hypothetical protein
VKALIAKKFGLVVAVTGLAVASYAAGAAQARQAVNTPASGIKWEPYAPGTPLQVAVLWGDRTKGNDYGMFLKMPAGFEAGQHAHTADYHGVGVQGNWVHTNTGSIATPQLPPGSYVFQPGKQMHNDICKGTTDCILFIHQHAPGDFIPGK